MSLASICVRPVVVIRRSRTGSAEPYGEDLLVEVGREPGRAHLHQRGTDEPNPGEQETVSTRWAATFPPGSPAPGRDDLVEVDGQSYELDGDPFPAYGPRQRGTHHTEVTLVQVVG